MELPNLLRPKWKHSSPAVRERAAEKIADQAILTKLATIDGDSSVRAAATARLVDQGVLARIARTDADSRVRWRAVWQLTDQATIADVARNDLDPGVRVDAAKKLTDTALAEAIYAEIASSGQDDKLIERITNTSVLAGVARSSPQMEVRFKAADELLWRARRQSEELPEVALDVFRGIATDTDAPALLRLAALKDACMFDDQHDFVVQIIPTIGDPEVRLAAARHFLMDKTEDPKAATSGLLQLVRTWVPIKPRSYIQTQFEGFAVSWASPRLVDVDDLDGIERLVLPNLEWSAKEPGFHHFTIDPRPHMGLAQVMTWSDGKGASFCVWRADGGLHLCGNGHAKY